MKNSWLLAVFFITALGVAAFHNILGGEFVLDDRAFLVANPAMGNPHSLVYFFNEHVWSYSNLGDVNSANYRPLYFLTLWLANFMGLANPTSLHLFSLLLHVLATLLLLGIIRRLIPDISLAGACFAVGLFAVHPVHSEAVAWIAAFIHPLATVFLLAAWLLHDRAAERDGMTSQVFALLLFVLALLSVEVTVTFPLFILLHDRIRHGRWRVAANAPYFALLAAYFAVRKVVLGGAVPLVLDDPGMWLRFPVFVLEYLRQLLLPWPQPLYLEMPAGWGVSLTALVVGALLVALGALLWRWKASEKQAALLAVAWTAVFLLPPLAAAFSPDARFALRSLYLPSAGICLLAAWWLRALPSSRRVLATGGMVLMLAVGLVGTLAANRLWTDDGVVYGRVIEGNPDYFGGYSGQAEYFERIGELDRAFVQYERAESLATGKDKAGPLERMGLILGQAGENDESLALYRRVVELEPDNAPGWIGIGNNLLALARPEEAVTAYRRALQADPGRWTACANLVMLLEHLGRPQEAAAYGACAKPPR